MSESQLFEDDSTSIEFTKFLEFAESLNIPINEDYLKQIRSHLEGSPNGTYVDVGVKDSKGHEAVNERRLQNALWRSWWRQRRARYNTGPQTLPSQEEHLDLKLDNMATGRQVWGKDIGDIPTEYTMNDLQEHELPVIGTYADSKVLPGFRYRVRVCGRKEDEFLFDGKALRLARIGPGYGKRLTFEDEDILSNENFFWSDSNPDGGYAFSIECISEGEHFDILDSRNAVIGGAVMTHVNKKQLLLSSHVDERGTTVTAYVEFKCKLSFDDHKGCKSQSCDVSLTGTVLSFKPLKSKIPTLTKLTGVELTGMGQCVLQKCI
ncbi:uncharacterized protein LOC110255107 [Exaiptasia diaphana]|uniref:Uncharacterized protein n=1 Tax=Exaiptasia diaphana TaxID=2652724 RepID=A0A913YBN3_EXADI|nr:uncharacterized protein LOC110255107 [Exaiptasia diaphana]KXJ21136.1 hypothetical protein AC249_AIPGENE25157 [Exaiptasia diaphana]